MEESTHAATGQGSGIDPLAVAAELKGLISKTASGPVPLEEALGVLGERFGVDVCAYWMVLEDATALICRRIWISPAVGEYGGDFAMVTLGLALPCGFGLAGRALARNDSVICDDHLSGLTFVRRKSAARIGLTAGCAVPIVVDGSTVAVVEVFATDMQGDLSDVAVELSATLAEVGTFDSFSS